MKISRRTFIRRAAVASGAAYLARGSRLLRAEPLRLAPGVQLFSAREEMEKDLDGTLRELAAMGYRDAELYTLPKAPREFRKHAEDAGLKCVSGTFFQKDLKDPASIAAAQELGLSYMTQVFPAVRSLPSSAARPTNVMELVPLFEKLSLSDYQWNAEQLNQCGENLKRHGIRVGFHTHTLDFKKYGDKMGFEVLLENTDPKLVCFEMDCGHTTHAGHDPSEFLNKYPTRIELLHIKDLVPGFQISTSLATQRQAADADIGAGSIDWKKIFQAAKHSNVKHYFVELEGKMAHPIMEALRNSCNYLQKLEIN